MNKYLRIIPTVLLMWTFTVSAGVDAPPSADQNVKSPCDSSEGGTKHGPFLPGELLPSPRHAHVYVGIGLPYPTLASLGAAYDILDYAQLFCGVGRTRNVVVSSFTWGCGLQILDSRRVFTPVLGVQVSNATQNTYSPPSILSGTERKTILSVNVGARYFIFDVLHVFGGLNWGITKRNGENQVVPYFCAGTSF